MADAVPSRLDLPGKKRADFPIGKCSFGKIPPTPHPMTTAPAAAAATTKPPYNIIS